MNVVTGGGNEEPQNRRRKPARPRSQKESTAALLSNERRIAITGPYVDAFESLALPVHSDTFSAAHRLSEALQQRMLSTSLATPVEHIILVNDIGVVEKLAEYIAHGLDGLIDLYERRRECTRGLCLASQLHSSSELTRAIDEDAYLSAIGYIIEHYREPSHSFEDLADRPPAVRSMLLDDAIRLWLSHLVADPAVKRFVHDIVVPKVICEQLLPLSDTRPFPCTLAFERQLANRAGMRLSSDPGKFRRGGSWRRLLEERCTPAERESLLTELRSKAGMPKCPAIMLEFHSWLARRGMSQVFHVYDRARYGRALARAMHVVEVFRGLAPADSRWQIAVRSIALEPSLARRHSEKDEPE